MIKVYTADVSILDNDTVFRKAYDNCTQRRRKKTDRLRFQKDKNLSVAAGLLLKHALKREGSDINDMIFSTAANGKPIIENGKIEFNLSHSGERAMCCISDLPVGCDVEKADKGNRDLLKIAEKYFFDREYEYIFKCKSEEEKLDMFFRLWTLKESFMKATGLGLALSLKDFSIDLDSDVITIRQDFSSDIYYEKELDIGNSYKSAICSKNINDVSVEDIDLSRLI